MVSDVNAVNKKNNSNADDWIYGAARFGAFGWLAFFITLLFLLVQNIVFALKPVEVMAERNGVVVGRVVFGEANIRNEDEVMADVKSWVARCVSVNKINIYEDLSICLNHMEKKMSDDHLAGYEKINYGPYVETYGCERTSTEFDMEQTLIKRNPDSSLEIYAEVFGGVLCNDGKSSSSQPFAYRIEALLKDKTIGTPLGLQINRFEEIE